LIGLLLILKHHWDEYLRSATRKKFENRAPTEMNDEGLATDDGGDVDDVCVSSSLPALKLKPARTSTSASASASASRRTVNRAKEKRGALAHIICWRQAASVLQLRFEGERATKPPTTKTPTTIMKRTLTTTPTATTTTPTTAATSKAAERSLRRRTNNAHAAWNGNLSQCHLSSAY